MHALHGASGDGAGRLWGLPAVRRMDEYQQCLNCPAILPRPCAAGLAQMLCPAGCVYELPWAAWSNINAALASLMGQVNATDHGIARACRESYMRWSVQWIADALLSWLVKHARLASDAAAQAFICPRGGWCRQGPAFSGYALLTWTCILVYTCLPAHAQ